MNHRGNTNKPIRSNRWGAGIHSPFACDLVTGVLFGKSDPESPYEPVIKSLPCRYRRQAGMVFRLVEYVSPAKIRIVGNLCFRDYTGLRFRERTTFAKGEDFPGIFSSENNEMIIWKETPVIFPEILTPIHNSFWILLGLRDKRMKNFLEFLRNSPAVQVTLEVHRTGIVVFNRELQKQDYVILNSYF